MEADFIDYLDYVPYTNDNEGVYSPRLIGMLLQICGYIDSVFKAMAEYQPFQKDIYCHEIIRRELKRDPTKRNLISEVSRTSTLSEPEKAIRRLRTMTLYCEAFERHYSLPSNNGSQLTAKVGWEEPRKQHNQRPFQSFSLMDKEKREPEWWGKYNAVKHTWHHSMKEANLRNVLGALAGAFLLNAVHLPSLRVLYDMQLMVAYIETGGKVFKGAIDHIYTLQPDDFQREFNKAEKAAFELKPIRFAWHYIIETPLFIFKHPRDASVEKLTKQGS